MTLVVMWQVIITTLINMIIKSNVTINMMFNAVVLEYLYVYVIHTNWSKMWNICVVVMCAQSTTNLGGQSCSISCHSLNELPVFKWNLHEPL